MKMSTLNSNQSPPSHDQPSADLIKCLLLKSPEKVLTNQNSPKIRIL